MPTPKLKQLDVDRDLDRDLSDREYELLVQKMDQVFKVARRPAEPKPSEAAPLPPDNNNNHVS